MNSIKKNAMRIFLKGLGLVLLTLVASTSWAQALLSPAQLQELLANDHVRVVDTRSPDAFEQRHIPGSVSAPYSQWRGPATNPGELPDMAELTELVQSLGLTPQTHAVVLYAGTNSTDFGSAARVYWTLKSLGMTQLSILNGGIVAWVDAGLPTDQRAPRVARSDWQPQFHDQWTATQDEVLDLLDDRNTLLVDARPVDFFDGKVAAPAAHASGTLPGAINLDNADFFEPGSAALMGRDELAKVAARLPAQSTEQTVSFCNTGHWAATDWFVLSEVLERPNVRMYPQSMVGWTANSTALPMMNEPSRAQKLRHMILSWSHRNLGTQAP